MRESNLFFILLFRTVLNSFLLKGICFLMSCHNCGLPLTTDYSCFCDNWEEELRVRKAVFPEEKKLRRLERELQDAQNKVWALDERVKKQRIACRQRESEARKKK